MMRIMMRGSKPQFTFIYRFDRNNSLKALFIGSEKFISPIFIAYMDQVFSLTFKTCASYVRDLSAP